MKPIEGAGIALVSYLLLTGGIILIEQGSHEPNVAGYLFVAVLSGIFSHRAADGLRNRFDAFLSFSKKDTLKDSDTDQKDSSEQLDT